MLLKYAENASVVPFYECVNLSSGYHLYTTDANCEVWGLPARRGVIGYIAQSNLRGTVELWRLRKNDHLYTISQSELASAQRDFGYSFEQRVGYVWPQASVPVERSYGNGEHYYQGGDERRIYGRERARVLSARAPR